MLIVAGVFLLLCVAQPLLPEHYAGMGQAVVICYSVVVGLGWIVYDIVADFRNDWK